MATIKNRILNVGCGRDTYGTDFIDLHPTRKNVRKVDLQNEKFPYKNDTFDVVYSSFVFEHLLDPQKVLKEMIRVCKKGGRVELITDNASFWYYSLDNRAHTGKYEQNQDYGLGDRHFGLYTDHHLIGRFKEENLDFIGVKYIDHFGNNLNTKGKIVFFISKLLQKILPIRRMGYGAIRIVGTKK